MDKQLHADETMNARACIPVNLHGRKMHVLEEQNAGCGITIAWDVFVLKDVVAFYWADAVPQETIGCSVLMEPGNGRSPPLSTMRDARRHDTVVFPVS